MAGALSEAAVEDLCIQIMNTTNNRGLKISCLPQSLNVPTALWFEANRIYHSVLQNDTSNNAINVLRATSAFPKGIKPRRLPKLGLAFSEPERIRSPRHLLSSRRSRAVCAAGARWRCIICLWGQSRKRAA